MNFSILVLTIALTTWSTVTSNPTCLTNQTDNWRLPTNVIPTHYDINLKTYLPGYGWKEDEKSETFEGTISISAEIREATNRIVLHSDSLNIHNQTIRSDDLALRNLGIVKVELIPALQFLVLHLNQELQPQVEAIITIEFSGKLRRDEKGFYLTGSPNSEKGQPEKLNAVTQFESTSARFMIPCFDEPEFKATWQVQLTHPTGTTALSNTMDETSQPISDEWIVTNFKKTVIMSSYLLALFVGDAQFREVRTDRGIRIRVYAPPVYINQVGHALNVAKLTVKNFEKHFNINYPMEKLDFVAVRDFAPAAMENWGLIVHVYDSILGDSFGVRGTVIHELAHQWFGNLVTMDFWHNLWLNEAFATYMGGRGLGLMNPEYDTDFHYTINSQRIGFMVDTTYAVRDMSRTSDGNIPPIGVAYPKGSSFLRMIEKLIGRENFDRAVRWYLFENQYGNVDEQDLYEAFELFKPSGSPGPHGHKLNISEFARCWTDQNGYPTVYVTETNNNTIRITQQMDQFLTKGFRNKGVCGYRWDVPIWYQQDGQREVQLAWLGRNQPSIELSVGLPVIVNANSNGFYKVSYSNRLLFKIAESLEQNVHLYSNSTIYRLLSDASEVSIDDAGKLHSIVKIAKHFVEDTNEDIKKKALSSLQRVVSVIEKLKKVHEDDAESIKKILSTQPPKIIADCKEIPDFDECYKILSPLDSCANESAQPGRSKERLLRFLTKETNRLIRDFVIEMIKCSDAQIFDGILDDERYHFTDKEIVKVHRLLNQTSSESASRHIIPPFNNFYLY